MDIKSKTGTSQEELYLNEELQKLTKELNLKLEKLNEKTEKPST